MHLSRRVIMKTCFKCNLNKPLVDFYKHSAMADGYLGKCKECAKLDVLQHRANNLEKIREYDKERSKNPERKKANVINNMLWRVKDKRRQMCHNAVSRAIKSGLLSKNPCIKCGNKISLANHEDYDKPLDVIWFCQPCHKQRHKEINQGLQCLQNENYPILRRT